MSTAERWRLVLGRYAAEQLPEGTGEEDHRLDAALDFLYGREYSGRGTRETEGHAPTPGSLDPSQVSLIEWLTDVRELFPAEALEVVEKHALQRYQLTGLVTDPEVLQSLEPNEDLLRTLLTLKGRLSPEVLGIARRIIAEVVSDLNRRLSAEVRPALTGRRHHNRHSPIPIAANFDPRGTIRRNLRHYDPTRRQLVLERVRFFERNARRLPWEIIVCVDQSGSMAGSVVHAAVMASILTGLPAFRVRLVVFDTSVVDLSDRVADPVEVLLSVQLGGGTHIAQAVRYCAGLVENPHRTILVLVTDFCEGVPPSALYGAVRELAEARVRMIGLAALDGQAQPFYDRRIAGALADLGMEIAALTPGQLAQWLVEVTA